MTENEKILRALLRKQESEQHRTADLGVNLALRRMAWLCSELEAGNAFNPNQYWSWGEQARRALRSGGFDA